MLQHLATLSIAEAVKDGSYMPGTLVPVGISLDATDINSDQGFDAKGGFTGDGDFGDLALLIGRPDATVLQNAFLELFTPLRAALAAESPPTTENAKQCEAYLNEHLETLRAEEAAQRAKTNKMLATFAERNLKAGQAPGPRLTQKVRPAVSRAPPLPPLRSRTISYDARL